MPNLFVRIPIGVNRSHEQCRVMDEEQNDDCDAGNTPVANGNHAAHNCNTGLSGPVVHNATLLASAVPTPRSNTPVMSFAAAMRSSLGASSGASSLGRNSFRDFGVHAAANSQSIPPKVAAGAIFTLQQLEARLAARGTASQSEINVDSGSSAAGPGSMRFRQPSIGSATPIGAAAGSSSTSAVAPTSSAGLGSWAAESRLQVSPAPPAVHAPVPSPLSQVEAELAMYGAVVQPYSAGDNYALPGMAVASPATSQPLPLMPFGDQQHRRLRPFHATPGVSRNSSYSSGVSVASAASALSPAQLHVMAVLQMAEQRLVASLSQRASAAVVDHEHKHDQPPQQQQQSNAAQAEQRTADSGAGIVHDADQRQVNHQAPAAASGANSQQRNPHVSEHPNAGSERTLPVPHVSHHHQARSQPPPAAPPVSSPLVVGAVTSPEAAVVPSAVGTHHQHDHQRHQPTAIPVPAATCPDVPTEAMDAPVVPGHSNTLLHTGVEGNDVAATDIAAAAPVAAQAAVIVDDFWEGIGDDVLDAMIDDLERNAEHQMAAGGAVVPASITTAATLPVGGIADQARAGTIIGVSCVAAPSSTPAVRASPTPQSLLHQSVASQRHWTALSPGGAAAAVPRTGAMLPQNHGTILGPNGTQLLPSQWHHVMPPPPSGHFNGSSLQPVHQPRQQLQQPRPTVAGRASGSSPGVACNFSGQSSSGLASIGAQVAQVVVASISAAAAEAATATSRGAPQMAASPSVAQAPFRPAAVAAAVTSPWLPKPAAACITTTTPAPAAAAAVASSRTIATSASSDDDLDWDAIDVIVEQEEARRRQQQAQVPGSAQTAVTMQPPPQPAPVPSQHQQQHQQQQPQPPATHPGLDDSFDWDDPALDAMIAKADAAVGSGKGSGAVAGAVMRSQSAPPVLPPASTAASGTTAAVAAPVAAAPPHHQPQQVQPQPLPPTPPLPPMESSIDLPPASISARLGAFGDPSVTFPAGKGKAEDEDGNDGSGSGSGASSSHAAPSSSSMPVPVNPFDRMPVFLRAVVQAVSIAHYAFAAPAARGVPSSSTQRTQQRIASVWYLAGIDDDRNAAGAAATATEEASTSAPSSSSRVRTSSIVLRDDWLHCDMRPGDVIHVVCMLEGRVVHHNEGGARARGSNGVKHAVHHVQHAANTSSSSSHHYQQPPPSDHRLAMLVATGATKPPSIPCPPPLPSTDACILVDASHNALVVHPDILLSPTRITAGSGCIRRGVIQEVMGDAGGAEDGAAEVPLLGTLKHALFEHGLLASAQFSDIVNGGAVKGGIANRGGPTAASHSGSAATAASSTSIKVEGGRIAHPGLVASLRAAAGTIVHDTRVLEDLYACGSSSSSKAAASSVGNTVVVGTIPTSRVLMADHRASDELRGVVPGIADWLGRYGPGSGSSAAGASAVGGAAASSSSYYNPPKMAPSSSTSMRVTSVVGVEDNLWSPVWGIKGIVDATVDVEFSVSTTAGAGGAAGGGWNGNRSGSGAYQPVGIGPYNRQPQQQFNQTLSLSFNDAPQPKTVITRRLPLELKTGKRPRTGCFDEHRAQMLVYALLMQERYGNGSDAAAAAAATVTSPAVAGLQGVGGVGNNRPMQLTAFGQPPLNASGGHNNTNNWNNNGGAAQVAGLKRPASTGPYQSASSSSSSAPAPWQSNAGLHLPQSRLWGSSAGPSQLQAPSSSSSAAVTLPSTGPLTLSEDPSLIGGILVYLSSGKECGEYIDAEEAARGFAGRGIAGNGNNADAGASKTNNANSRDAPPPPVLHATLSIPSVWAEQRSLLVNRNQMATAILVARRGALMSPLTHAAQSSASSSPSSSSSSGGGGHLGLPPLIQDARECGNCWAIAACATLYACRELPAARAAKEKAGLASPVAQQHDQQQQQQPQPLPSPGIPDIEDLSPGVRPLFTAKTQHITPGHASYVNKWLRLIDLEAEAQAGGKEKEKDKGDAQRLHHGPDVGGKTTGGLPLSLAGITDDPSIAADGVTPSVALQIAAEAETRIVATASTRSALWRKSSGQREEDGCGAGGLVLVSQTHTPVTVVAGAHAEHPSSAAASLAGTLSEHSLTIAAADSLSSVSLSQRASDLTVEGGGSAAADAVDSKDGSGAAAAHAAAAAASSSSAAGGVYTYVFQLYDSWKQEQRERRKAEKAASAAGNSSTAMVMSQTQGGATQATPSQSAAGSSSTPHSLLSLDIGIGDWLLCSGDARGPYGLLAGAVVAISATQVVVRGDRNARGAIPYGFADWAGHAGYANGALIQGASGQGARALSGHQSSSRPFQWRIDKDEVMISSYVMKDNVLKMVMGRAIDEVVEVEDDDRVVKGAENDNDAGAVEASSTDPASKRPKLSDASTPGTMPRGLGRGDPRKKQLIIDLDAPVYRSASDAIYPWSPGPPNLAAVIQRQAAARAGRNGSSDDEVDVDAATAGHDDAVAVRPGGSGVPSLTTHLSPTGGFTSFPRHIPSSPLCQQLRHEFEHTLNDDQRAAITLALRSKDYACLLGMPGTGKTSTIAFLVRCLVASGKSVLITSHTHTAVDTLLLKLAEHNNSSTDGGNHSNDVHQPRIALLRIGRAAAVHADLHPYTLDAMVQSGAINSLSQFHDVLSQGQVVGATCLAIRHILFARRVFDVCILDEAGQVPEPIAIGPLRCARSFVLVGDHYQLPPLVVSKEAKQGGMEVSLFKRLADAHPASVVPLTRQYRMNGDIMSIPNLLIYDGRLKCGSQAVNEGRYRLPKRMMTAATKHITAATTSSTTTSMSKDWLTHVLSASTTVCFLDTDTTTAAVAVANAGGDGAPNGAAFTSLESRRVADDRDIQAAEKAVEVAKAAAAAALVPVVTATTAAAAAPAGASASATQPAVSSSPAVKVNVNSKVERYSKNSGTTGAGGAAASFAGSGGLVNRCEVSIVVQTVMAMLLCGGAGRDIGIISPYRSQLKLLRSTLDAAAKAMDDSCAHAPSSSRSTSMGPDEIDSRCIIARPSTTTSFFASEAADVEVETVDRYQGRDKPVIIMSLVRSNGNKQVGSLLSDVRRLNVAFTRAKHKLVLIGCGSTLAGGNESLASLINHCDTRKWSTNLPIDAQIGLRYGFPMVAPWQHLQGMAIEAMDAAPGFEVVDASELAGAVTAVAPAKDAGNAAAGAAVPPRAPNAAHSGDGGNNDADGDVDMVTQLDTRCRNGGKHRPSPTDAAMVGAAIPVSVGSALACCAHLDGLAVFSDGCDYADSAAAAAQSIVTTTAEVGFKRLRCEGGVGELGADVPAAAATAGPGAELSSASSSSSPPMGAVASTPAPTGTIGRGSSGSDSANGGGGFSTGSGRAVKMSAAAMARARAVMSGVQADVVGDGSGTGGDGHLDGSSSSTTDECDDQHKGASAFSSAAVDVGEANVVPPLSTFSSGRAGRAVRVSDAARARARALMSSGNACCDDDDGGSRTSGCVVGGAAAVEGNADSATVGAMRQAVDHNDNYACGDAVMDTARGMPARAPPPHLPPVPACGDAEAPVPSAAIEPPSSSAPRRATTTTSSRRKLGPPNTVSETAPVSDAGKPSERRRKSTVAPAPSEAPSLAAPPPSSSSSAPETAAKAASAASVAATAAALPAPSSPVATGNRDRELDDNENGGDGDDAAATTSPASAFSSPSAAPAATILLSESGSQEFEYDSEEGGYVAKARSSNNKAKKDVAAVKGGGKDKGTVAQQPVHARSLPAVSAAGGSAAAASASSSTVPAECSVTAVKAGSKSLISGYFGGLGGDAGSGAGASSAASSSSSLSMVPRPSAVQHHQYQLQQQQLRLGYGRSAGPSDLVRKPFKKPARIGPPQ